MGLISKISGSRFYKNIFGYDVFISYSRRDSMDYAYALSNYLTSKKIKCYIDQLSSTRKNNIQENEFGDISDNVIKGIKNCKGFILICSAGANVSSEKDPITKEIDLFNTHGDEKFFIPIVIEGALNLGNIDSKNLNCTSLEKRIHGLPRRYENIERFKSAKPGEELLNKIENALNFTRNNQRLRQASIATVLSVLLITSGLVGITIFQLKSAEKKVDDANAKELNANNSAKTAEAKADSANLVAKNSQGLAILAGKQKSEADNLKDIAVEEKRVVENQKRIAEEKVGNLNFQSDVLQFRIAAMNYMESDPVKAYRLAEQAYNLDKSEENRKIVLSTVSSIDYYYKSVLDSFQIVDFKDPYILLINKAAKKNEPNLAVYDTRTSSLRKTSLITDRFAWIIPYMNSWKILTMNWSGEGIDGMPEYQLWNDAFDSVSEIVHGGALALPQFISIHKVSIDLSRQPKTLLWNLLSNEKQYISHDTTDTFGGYFREIYGPLDTRRDGISAAHEDNGLVLVDTNGKVVLSSYTQVDFDPSSFYSQAKWSPDDRYLALNYFEIKALGIWDPTQNSFNWFGSPDQRPFNLAKRNKWIINTYSWSQKNHLLAFSGRTENDVDVTVEIVDASSPEKTRRIIYKGDIPIKSIAFLPGDEKIVICDKESNMSIIEIATKKIVGKGQQADLVKGSPLGFYSTSSTNFKSWHKTPAPSKYWFFKSDSIRTYYSEGAADSINKWIAALYFQRSDTTIGIDVRNVITGENKFIQLPNDPYRTVQFTSDGNWLIHRNSKHLYFWNTNTWQKSVIEIDRMFGRFESNENVIYASFDSLEYKITYKYDLNSPKPRFLGRISKVEKTSTDVKKTENSSEYIEELITGWKLDKLYKYRSAGWLKSGRWALRVTCRDKALGANDCDILFIPTDVDWLIKMYDNLLWRPTKEELYKIVQNKNRLESGLN